MSVLTVVNIASMTGLPEDTVVNNFALASTRAQIETNLDAARTAFADFYNLEVAPGTMAIKDFFAPTLDVRTNACSVKFYDLTNAMGGEPHGSPFATRSWTLLAPDAATPLGLPSEVAGVLTLEAVGYTTARVEVPDTADPGTAPDRPKSRHRGRVYIGPLNSMALQTVDYRTRFHQDFINALTRAGDRLHDQLKTLFAAVPGGGDYGGGLGVWSRSDRVIRTVESVSADNAPDTVRRRGTAPTSRTRLTV